MNETPKRKRGRPYAGGETPKRYYRMTDDEFAWIEAAAESLGQTVSEFTRETLLRRAKRVVDRPIE